jgi:hypothetical protein
MEDWRDGRVREEVIAETEDGRRGAWVLGGWGERESGGGKKGHLNRI